MNHVAPVMPMNLPTTRPATMPHVNGDRSAAPTLSMSSRTPALTNANSGSTTNDTYGPITVCSRSLIEIDSRRPRVAARAYCELGDWRNARIISTVCSTCLTVGCEDRDQQRDRDTGQRGMNAGRRQRDPQREAEHGVGGAAARRQEPDQRERQRSAPP